MIECNCAYCGAVLEPRMLSKIPKTGLTFCNHSHRAAYFAPIQVACKCACCGKDLESRSQWRISKSGLAFCNRECCDSHKKFKRVECKCAYCGKDLPSRIPSSITKNGNTFCNHKCRSLFKQKRIACKCLYCGIDIEPRVLSKIPKTGLTFCNHSHRAAYFAPELSDRMSGFNHPNFGKRGEESKNFGKKRSEETKNKIRGKNNHMFGKKHSNETKEKIRNSATTEERRDRSLGKKNGMYGKHHSDVEREKMSDRMSGKNNSNYGKHHSKEVCEIIRQANLGREHSNETKEKLRASQLERKIGGFWNGAVDSIVNTNDYEILHQEIRHSQKYIIEWREFIYERDGYKDFFTGEISNSSGNLVAHHLKSFSIICKENIIKTMQDAINCKDLWNVNNGVTMLKKYHVTKKFHKLMRDKFGENIKASDFTEENKKYVREIIYPQILKS